jgi:hypothetical protein
VSLGLGLVQIHTQAGNGRSLDESIGVCRERAQTFLGRTRLTRRVLAFRPIQLQRKREVMPALPAILLQERCARGEICKSRGERRGALRTLASHQVELRQLLALLL